MSTTEKFRKVKIKTKLGDRYLTFKPVKVEDFENGYICETDCPYGEKICGRLRNPEVPDDETQSFMDFCSNLDLEDKTMELYVPIEGTLESNLFDLDDVNKELINNRELVSVKEVIDSVCDGMCDLYDKTHCNCKMTNPTCLLQDLFKKKKKNG